MQTKSHFNPIHRRYLAHTRSYLGKLLERKDLLDVCARDGGHLRGRRGQRRLDKAEAIERAEHVKQSRSLSREIQQLCQERKAIYQAARELEHPLCLDALSRKYGLNQAEHDILLVMVASEAFGDYVSLPVSPGDMLRLLFGHNTLAMARYRRLFYQKSRLRKCGLIRTDWLRNTLADCQFSVSERLVRHFLEEREIDEQEIRAMEDEPDGEFGKKGGGVLNLKTPVVRLNQVHLKEHVRRDLLAVLNQLKHQDMVFKTWGFGAQIAYGRALALLFYGPPGTGKTMTAEALAHAVGKSLGIVDYSRVINCYVGESEKNIVKIFEEARDHKCVLLFDECDALFQSRLDARSSVDQMNNRVANLLLQQIESFDGLIILTTNREVGLDKAFERRFALRVGFDLPDAALRARIWRGYFSRAAPLARQVDFQGVAARYALTGGEVKNAVLRAVRQCLTLPERERQITQEMLERAAQEELSSRLDRARTMPIGFQ